jgi:adenylate cyclase
MVLNFTLRFLLNFYTSLIELTVRYRQTFCARPQPHKIIYYFQVDKVDIQMSKNNGPPLIIDLNEFNLAIDLKGKRPVSLHFNTSSRKFYLSLIALVVLEMKRRGKVIPISLTEHLDLLALINETVGGSAGSSEKENLLPRIYRKWKHALPNLEEAPLFKVLGRRKDDDGAEGRTYPFTEREKDQWANLFAYTGSEENVRLKFDVEKIGLHLNDVVITFNEFRNEEAWGRFLAGLRGEEKPAADTAAPLPEEPKIQKTRPETSPPPRFKGAPRAVWAMAVLVVLCSIALGIWKPWSKPAPTQVASVSRMAYPLPDKPSLAVLPFENLSGDPQQEYFSDGITESIISALSKIPRLFVIARKSSFSYKGKPVTVRQVSEELGVRYVLEGSVQKSGDRVRITAQLIDALTGHHLWAERYEGNLKDIFTLQDEVTMKITTALRVELSDGEQALRMKPSRNLEAFLKALQAQANLSIVTKEGNAKGKRLAEEALALDHEFPNAHTLLCLANLLDVSLGLSSSPKESIDKALELGQKAIALDPKDSRPYAYLGFLYTLKREHDRAITQGERALALDPGGADAHAWLGICLNYADRSREAIPMFEKAIRLNPYGPAFYFHNLGHTYRFLGRYPEAVTQYQKSLRISPDNILAHLGLAATYSLMGSDLEAQAEAQEILRINPKFSVESYARSVPHKNQAKLDRYIDALRQAGLK